MLILHRVMQRCKCWPTSAHGIFFLYYSCITILTEAKPKNVLLGSVGMTKTLANLTGDTTRQRNTTCPSPLPPQIKLRKAMGFKMPNNYYNSFIQTSIQQILSTVGSPSSKITGNLSVKALKYNTIPTKFSCQSRNSYVYSRYY